MARADMARLEPVVAHGSRMSWAGILRPGDEFPPARKSQLAVLAAESGPPVKRYFGRWSDAHHRFTTNLTSANIVVRTLKQGERPRKGVVVVLHWVDRRDVLRSGKGGVCRGDGWPVELWDAFVSESGNLPPGTVAEKLRSFADSRVREDDRLVAEWRALLKEGRVIPPGEGERRSLIGQSLLPAPVELIDGDLKRMCIVSWAPVGRIYRHLSEALSSPEAALRPPDLESQAKYYLECTLARLHGVRFGPDDWIEDKEYESQREFLEIGRSFGEQERRRIAKMGSLDRFSPAQK